jgi:hypothetical protein
MNVTAHDSEHTQCQHDRPVCLERSPGCGFVAKFNDLRHLTSAAWEHAVRHQLAVGDHLLSPCVTRRVSGGSARAPLSRRLVDYLLREATTGCALTVTCGRYA